MIAFHTSAQAITPNDTGTVMQTSGVYVGGAGDLTVTMAGAGATQVTFKAVPAGMFFPGLSVVRVWATGTSATNIVVLR